MFDHKEVKTEHPIIEPLANRWSPRAFADKPVEKDKLLRVLEAARWAPSSRNEQPWRFLIAQKGEAHYEKVFEGLNPHNQEWAWTAPVIGVSLTVRTFARNNSENTFRLHDVGLAMGNLVAQATHEGLYVHQMAGIVPEAIVENFDLDKSRYEVVAMFAMGYHDEKRLEELDEKYREREYAERSRKPLNDLVFGDRIGKSPSWMQDQ